LDGAKKAEGEKFTRIVDDANDLIADIETALEA